ncbi:ataxin-1-like [Pholidichthys leucotaenia]
MIGVRNCTTDPYGGVRNTSPLKEVVQVSDLVLMNLDLRVTKALMESVSHDHNGTCTFGRGCAVLVRVSENNSNHQCNIIRDDPLRSPAALSSSNQFPWRSLTFVAGSLIELTDGRLRKVEHLQTEDFLLGSLACPTCGLSCYTVQSISPSASSSSICRLIILLHDQQSQEIVDVYVEYPFFVRGRGWSSCSPQRTARLCGLQCHQLGVGDVCLALTPASAPPPSVAREPKASPSKSGGSQTFEVGKALDVNG